MFSGIVEAQSELLSLKSTPPSAKLKIKRPQDWSNLTIGDSIAVNGVCLTLEASPPDELCFTLGPETLLVTCWHETLRPGQILNLEQSMKIGDRLHGHFVPGHVDEMGSVISSCPLGDSLEIWIQFSDRFKAFVWRKGSVAVNGVSLTINQVLKDQFQVVLVPETLAKTNLGKVASGDRVCLEADFMARAVTETLRHREVPL